MLAVPLPSTADLLCSAAKSARHSPRTVFEQVAGTHAPPRRIALFEQDRHCAGPLPAHEPQELSHPLHNPLASSKYCELEQVVVQLFASVRTGRLDEQLAH